MKNLDPEYTCRHCGKEFLDPNTKAAEKEFAEVFPEFQNAPVARLCDLCWKNLGFDQIERAGSQ